SFTGVVLIMEPGPDFKRYGQARSLTKALWQRLKKYPSAVAFSLLLALCLVVPGLLIPMFTKIFVDQYILAQLEQWLRPLLFVMLLTFIVQWLLELSRMRVLRRLATGLSASESARFVWHILHLPVSFYDQRFSGEITNRIALNDRVADLIAGDLALAFLDLLMVSVYSVVLFFFDPLLCAIGVGLSVLTLFTLRIVSRTRVDAQRRMTMEVGRAQGIALAGFQSIETLKASGHEGSFFERWAGHYAGSVNAQLKLGMSAMLLSVLPTAMQGLTSAIILGMGALRVMDGELSVGDLMAFQLLMTQLQLPVTRFVDLGSRLQELEADLDRIDDVFQAETDSRSKSEPDYPDWEEGKIRLGG
ncbi:MAG: ABC transporter transmembrane domain-containing protein, partial [Planctomycetota bacterium]|nr:ABC transporter transmembrane domain-containing protein [Planctomycetota bacterium]